MKKGLIYGALATVAGVAGAVYLVKRYRNNASGETPAPVQRTKKHLTDVFARSKQHIQNHELS